MDKGAIRYFEKYLKILRSRDLYPVIHTVTGPSYAPKVTIGSKEFLSFSSNNYMGMAGNKDSISEAKKTLESYGLGSGSTRLLSGTLDIQIAFEKQLADFFGFEDSITFSSGYLANVGVIRMLVDPFPYFQMFGEGSGVILSDELNHASIIDGVRLSKAKRERYPHSDMEALEKLLAVHKGKRILILTDGVFSMDGDLAKLPELCDLSEKYDALLMVDDSHGVGILGPRGEGVAHHFGVQKRVDILMGSFTKAFGSIGGFIAANKKVTDYLRVTARSYIFSDPIPPSLVAGLMEQTRLIAEGTEIRDQTIGNAEYLRSQLKERGFTVLGEKTTIVPLLVGSEKKAIHFSNALIDSGIMAPCIRRPAVAEGKERMRFSVTALHSREDIDRLLHTSEAIGKDLKLI